MYDKVTRLIESINQFITFRDARVPFSPAQLASAKLRIHARLDSCRAGGNTLRGHTVDSMIAAQDGAIQLRS